MINGLRSEIKDLEEDIDRLDSMGLGLTNILRVLQEKQKALETLQRMR